MKLTKKATIILIVAILLFVTGCTAETGENIIFGSFYNIQLKGFSSRSSLKKINELLNEIENQTSTVIEGSDVYKINNAQADEAVKIGHHTYELFKSSMELYELTDWAFNAAIYPLVELWKFSPDKYSREIDTLPPNADIIAMREFSKMEFFQLDEESRAITKKHNMAKLDFGGITKGYAIDLVKELIKDLDQGLINIGGDILPYSRQAIIGIKHPRQSGLFGKIKIKDLALSTSGDYERYYIVDDVRYSHIIDKNGYPSSINSHDIIAASVIGESAMYCDALATAITVNGLEWAYDNLQEMGYSALCISIPVYNQDAKYYNIVGDIDFEPSQSAYEENIPS